MKNFINDHIVENNKKILFFGFYFLFFIFVFLFVTFGGDKNYLHQEYEQGNSSGKFEGLLKKNYLFDFTIHIDGNTYNYYGKKVGDIESFKYNGNDYFRNESSFYMKKDTWEEVENPYQFYEFMDYDSLLKVVSKVYLQEQGESSFGGKHYQFLLSTNSLNALLYQNNTDFEENPNSFLVDTDSSNNIRMITYQLDSFCSLNSLCENTLLIEMKYDMMGEIKEIDSPL